MSLKPLLIVIAGPTAVGKTALAVSIASKLKTEIISFDSRQIYRELNIGVAKPETGELNKVKHHFISSLSVETDYNAGAFARESVDLLNELFKKYTVVVAVGGSGLYLKAMLDGFDVLPAKDELLREELKSLVHESGINALREKYLALFPSHPIKELNNPQRLMRAIEVELSNSGASTDKMQNRNFETACFFLNMDRSRLYQRINLRVDQMILAGLENEVKELLAFKELNALQTVGYREFFRYFDGQIDKDQAVELIKKNSRNYAKRQLTWFRNDPRFNEIQFEEDVWKYLESKDLLQDLD